jgi:hypothetical protein
MSAFWLNMLAQSLAREPALEGDELGGPPVLSPLEERVAALEQDLRAGITRAENDLEEARAVAKQIRNMLRFRCSGSLEVATFLMDLREHHPWLSEA